MQYASDAFFAQEFVNFLLFLQRSRAPRRHRSISHPSSSSFSFAYLPSKDCGWASRKKNEEREENSPINSKHIRSRKVRTCEAANQIHCVHYMYNIGENSSFKDFSRPSQGGRRGVGKKKHSSRTSEPQKPTLPPRRERVEFSVRSRQV